MICVVIPYYQKSPEPLRKAIASVFSQEGVSVPHILIVDDESPIPASGIVESYFPDHGGAISIIVQKNAGAAAARNTGLDNLPADTKYVAFLDSDDEWTPDHLANAVRVLESGCDFYFAGHKREDWDHDRFTQMGLVPDEHKCIDAEKALFEYSGDMLHAIISKHMIKTSTVVFRRNGLEDIRFPEHLVLGEDDVFWVRATRRARRIGFCSNVEVKMGDGVNISQGGEWGDERSIQLMSLNMLKWQSMPALLPDEPQLESIRKSKMAKLRHDLAGSVLHRIRRRQKLPMKHIAACTSADPRWLFTLLQYPFKRNRT